GLVPTLQEDDFTLWESNAIMRHLGADSALFPRDARVRADIDRWMDAQQTTMNRPQGTIFINLIRTPPEKRDQSVIDAAIKEAAGAWRLIATELGKHDFICGDALTLADLCWGVHVHRWLNMHFDRPDVPNLKAWYDRLLARPAYRQHVARAIV
ncbi:MAG: glutathione S-transferase C-terminal domain-containing protein, partial [Acetobacteraceae bacterium]